MTSKTQIEKWDDLLQQRAPIVVCADCGSLKFTHLDCVICMVGGVVLTEVGIDAMNIDTSEYGRKIPESNEFE